MEKKAKLYQKSYQTQRKLLEDHCAKAKLNPDCIKPIIEHLLPIFAKADARALWNQAAFVRAAIAVYCLSAFAVSIAIVQLLFLPKQYEIIWGEVAAILLALLLIYVSRRYRWQRRWLSDRHLAEQLRSAMFLLLIPERHKANVEPMEVLPFYGTPDPELHESVRKALEHERLKECLTEDLPAAKKFVIDGWIRVQVNFHRRNAERRRRQSLWMHLSTIGLLSLTLLAAALHAAGFGHVDSSTRGGHGVGEFMGLMMILFTIALPAWAATLNGISDMFDWERMNQRSVRMAEVLETKTNLAEKARTFEELQAIARDAEWIMAMENYEWFVSLLFRHPRAA